MRSLQQFISIIGITLVFMTFIIIFADMDAITGKQYAPSAGGGGNTTSSGNPLSVQDWCVDMDNGNIPGTASYGIQVRANHDPIQILTNATAFSNVAITHPSNQHNADAVTGPENVFAGSFNYTMPNGKTYKAEGFRIQADYGQLDLVAESQPTEVSTRSNNTTESPPSASETIEPETSGGSQTIASSGDDVGDGIIITQQSATLYEVVCDSLTVIKKGNPNVMNGKLASKKHTGTDVKSEKVNWIFINMFWQNNSPYNSNPTQYDLRSPAQGTPAPVSNGPGKPPTPWEKIDYLLGGAFKLIP